MSDEQPDEDREVGKEHDGEESSIDREEGISQISPDTTILLWRQRTVFLEGRERGTRPGAIRGRTRRGSSLWDLGSGRKMGFLWRRHREIILAKVDEPVATIPPFQIELRPTIVTISVRSSEHL